VPRGRIATDMATRSSAERRAMNQQRIRIGRYDSRSSSLLLLFSSCSVEGSRSGIVVSFEVISTVDVTSEEEEVTMSSSSANGRMARNWTEFERGGESRVLSVCTSFQYVKCCTSGDLWIGPLHRDEEDLGRIRNLGVRWMGVGTKALVVNDAKDVDDNIK